MFTGGSDNIQLGSQVTRIGSFVMRWVSGRRIVRNEVAVRKDCSTLKSSLPWTALHLKVPYNDAPDSVLDNAIPVK